MKYLPLLFLVGCSAAANKQAVNTVLDIAQATCVLTHSEFSNEEAVRKACQITDDLAPVVHDLLGAAKAAKAAGAKADAGCK